MTSADGLQTEESEDSSLFWALRGGGAGPWGVVTALTIRLHKPRLFFSHWFYLECYPAYPPRGECTEACYTQWNMVWEGSWEEDDGMVAQEVSPCEENIPNTGRCLCVFQTSDVTLRCWELTSVGQRLPATIGARMGRQILTAVTGNTTSPLVRPCTLAERTTLVTSGAWRRRWQMFSLIKESSTIVRPLTPLLTRWRLRLLNLSTQATVPPKTVF